MREHDKRAITHLNIQSNTFRGEMKDAVIDRTIAEVHNTMKTVFGPYATDAWITKEGVPYYTRDGKEVFASTELDCELSEYIRRLLYQAVENQARKVGDGTTTLLVLYTNLYQRFREMLTNFSSTANQTTPYNITTLRQKYNDLIESIVAEMEIDAKPITDNLLKSMIYTCTQDAELTDLLYTKLHDAMMERAFIIAQKSSMETDLEVSVNNYPMIKATKIYESKSVDNTIIHNAAVFFVNGMLDISDVDILLSMASVKFRDSHVFPSICFLCSGVTEATRQTLKRFSNLISNLQRPNLIYIFTIDNYKSYSTEEVDDLIAYIYDRPESSGLDNHLSFEAYLYQAFVSQNEDGSWDNETLGKFDTDPQNLMTMKQAMLSVQKLEYRSGDGIRFYREPGPISQARYQELLEKMDKDNSPMNRINIKNRLKKLYGKFIEVNVGSKLMKDGQRKFEIVLDAIISSNNAVEHGVLSVNSIYDLLDILSSRAHNLTPTTSSVDRLLLMSLYNATMDTLMDMVRNKYPNMDDAKLRTAIESPIRALNLYDPNNPVPFSEDGTDRLAFDLTREFDKIFSTSEEYETIKTASGMEISTQVVEPVSVMTNILQNSTLMLEIAAAKTFVLDAPIREMGNYID